MSRQEWTGDPRSTSARLSGRRGARYHRKATRLGLEPLEVRNLLAATLMAGPISLITELGPNDTLDLAQDVGDLGRRRGVAVAGLIGDGPAGPADVDWYRFTLDRPAHVSLSAKG